MTPNEILCRCCQQPYDVPEGCAICEVAKKNIVWPSLAEDTEAHDLTRLARRTVRLLESNVQRLEHSMKHAATREYYPAHGREAAALAKAMAAVLTEARKLEQHEAQRVKTGTFEDQVGIWTEWVLSLPREYQAKVLAAFEERLLPAGPAELVDE